VRTNHRVAENLAPFTDCLYVSTRLKDSGIKTVMHNSMIARESFQCTILDLSTWANFSLDLDKTCIPCVRDIEPLKHQQDEQNDAFPETNREDGSGEGGVEMTSQLVPGLRSRSSRLREFYEFVTSTSNVNDVVLCDIQQVMVESSQEVFPAAEEENNSGPGGSTAGT
jgi:hypothetical protein